MRRLWIIATSLVAACGSEPATCPDNVGLVVSNFVTDGYNTVVRGSGGGSALNVSWTCPNGGAATITGSANTSTVTFDLTFQFAACSDSSIENLTLTGSLRDQTTNGGSSGSRDETAHSDALKIAGHDALCNADPIDATCVFDYVSSPTTTTASVCGLKYP